MADLRWRSLLNVVDELLAEQTPTETELAEEIINLAHEEKVEEWIEAIALEQELQKFGLFSESKIFCKSFYLLCNTVIVNR